MTSSVYGLPNRVPELCDAPPVQHKEILDAVILGGGLSGLTALHELKDKNVRLLEWSSDFGGLAAQGAAGKHVYARGAAYFTKPRGEVADFYARLGLGAPERVEIPGSIDSYDVAGIVPGERILLKDMWEEHTLARLPPEFRAFKNYLVGMRDAGMIGEVPLENEPRKVQMWDSITVATMIKPFGPKVKELLDLYCRSALGRTSDQLSAMAFLNFYVDEIEVRYAFPGGTGGVSKRIEDVVRHDNPESLIAGAWVYDVHHRPDGLVEVRFNQDGKNHSFLARQVISALPLNAAADVIKDLPQERRDLIASIKHTNYLVHNVITPEPVYTKSYDTWVNRMSFQDVIVGRWHDTHGFTKPGKKKGPGILTVYQPLPPELDHSALSGSEVAAFGKQVLADLEKLFPKLTQQQRVHIESSRWPQSIHVVEPGHLTVKAPRLRASHGNIVFAGNNLGLPSFEEAIHRGLKAAADVRARLGSVEQAA